MAMERYNPTARASSRQMPSNGATPGNLGQGDPVNGYPFGSTTPGYIDYRNPADNGDFYEGTKRQQYRDDPNARLLHSPGSSRAEQSGWWETSGKNLSDIHEPFSWTAADEARDQAEQAQRRAADDAGWRARGFSGSDWWQSDPEYQQFLASGNKRGASRRKNDLLTEAKRKIQRDSFIAQGGRGETWDHRFDENNHWPKPRSPLGAYSHGPGSADWDTRFTNPPPPNTIGGGVRRGATPQANAPMSAGAPPSQNPMFQGYLGGGAGTVSGGQGGQFGGLQNWMAQAGGYNPGASTGSAGLYNDASLYDSPMAAQGRTAPWQGTAPGGRQPIGPFNPTIDPSTRPGSAPSWASAQPGYAPFNPGNFSMPYDTGGMWQMFGGSPMGGGMNYAQMQNYLGLQPQGAPNWIGL